MDGLGLAILERDRRTAFCYSCQSPLDLQLWIVKNFPVLICFLLRLSFFINMPVHLDTIAAISSDVTF